MLPHLPFSAWNARQVATLILVAVALSPPLQGQSREAAMDEAGALYATADRLHQQRAYSDAIAVSKQALALLFPFTELPTDVQIIERYYADVQSQSGILLVHLRTEHTDLTLAPGALAHADSLAREARRTLTLERGTFFSQISQRVDHTEGLRQAAQAREAYKEVLGERHLDVLDVLQEHASLYTEYGLRDQAALLREQIEAIQGDLLGPNSRHVLDALFIEAAVYETAALAETAPDEAEDDPQKDDYLAQADSLLAVMIERAGTAYPHHVAEGLRRRGDLALQRNAPADAVRFYEEAEATDTGPPLSAELALYLLPTQIVTERLSDRYQLLYEVIKSTHREGILATDSSSLAATDRFRAAADSTLPLRNLVFSLQSQTSPLAHGINLLFLRVAQSQALSGLLTLAAKPDADPATVASALDVVLQHKARAYDRETYAKASYLAGDAPIVDRLHTGLRERASRVARLTYTPPNYPMPESDAEADDEPEKRPNFLVRFWNWLVETVIVIFKGAKALNPELTPSDSLYVVYADELSQLRRDQERIRFHLHARSDVAYRVEEPTTALVAQAVPAGTHLVEVVRYQPYDFGRLRLLAEDSTRWIAVEPEAFAVPERYVAFVLAPNAAPQLFDLGLASEIDSLVTRFREELRLIDTDLMGSEAMQESAEVLATITTPLYERLWAPLGLPETGTTYLALDGMLRILPYEVLTDADGRALIEAHQLNYLGSGRDLLRTLEANTDVGGMIVMGDVDYGPGAPSVRGADASENANWVALAQTAPEVEAIQGAFGLPETDVLRGSEASERRLGAVATPRRLHIATHGFFLDNPTPLLNDPAALSGIVDGYYQALFPSMDQEDVTDEEDSRLDQFCKKRPQFVICRGRDILDIIDRFGRAEAFLNDLAGSRDEAVRLKTGIIRWTDPLVRSALVMADRNTFAADTTADPLAGTPDDGLATAYEIGWMDLRGTELVVLSACETGLGDAVTGEGVFGLGRSFQTAGARTVVMSLWQVDDQATSELMVDYYARLSEGTSKGAALRQAALAVKETQPHPYFWAPFVSMGDPN